MAKKPAKAPAKTSAAKAAKPDDTKAAAPKAKPAVPAKPVPAHQQFLTQGANQGGAKNQHMAKGRIFRHQGR